MGVLLAEPPTALAYARGLISWPLRLGPPTAEGYAPPVPFRRLAVMHLLSSAGDAMVAVALAGSVFVSVSITAARSRTALGLLCTFLPFLVVGPFLGNLIDRSPGGRKATLCVASFGRAGGCLAMAAWIHGFAFFPAALGTLVCSKAYLISRAAILPSVVERGEDLVPANAKLALGSAMASSVAGAVGAAIFRIAGSTAVLHVDVVVLVACAILAAGLAPACGWSPSIVLNTPCPSRVVSAGRAPTRHPVPPGGLHFLAVTMAAMRAAAGLMTVLVIFAFRRQGAPLYWYAMVGAASVVGNLAGAVLAPVVERRVRRTRIVPGCAVVIGAVGLMVTQIRTLHGWPAAVVLAVTVTSVGSVAKLALDALVQEDGSAARRGRLFARLEALFQFVWVLGALIPILLVLGLRGGFLVVGLVTLAGAGVGIGGLAMARAHRLPSWWPGALRRCALPKEAATAGS